MPFYDEDITLKKAISFYSFCISTIFLLGNSYTIISFLNVFGTGDESTYISVYLPFLRKIELDNFLFYIYWEIGLILLVIWSARNLITKKDDVVNKEILVSGLVLIESQVIMGIYSTAYPFIPFVILLILFAIPLLSFYENPNKT